MLTIRSATADLTCSLSRRDALRLAFGGMLGTGLVPGFSPHSHAEPSQESAAAPGFGHAKSLILIYLYGGPSHIDVWDLKPEAPAEIRGEFRPIDTKVPGLQLCEHLPKLAAMADRLSVVRSLTHGESGHGAAAHWMLTGQAPGSSGEIAPTPQDHPHIGSVVAARETQIRREAPRAPAFVSLPWRIATQINVIPAQDAGYLGRQFDPLLAQYTDLQGDRFKLPDSAALESAGQLHRETDATRDRYGRNVFGQSVLLARRLVEAGVRVVTVYWPDRRDDKGLFYHNKRQPVSVPMWDTHGSSTGDTANFPSLKNRLLPPLDLASSALLDDLAASGRLGETLVVWTGEFGRTPKIQGDGRSHYSRAFSSMLAGGGTKGGLVYGRTDATASTVVDNPIGPGDFLATMYHLLGVPSDIELAGPDAPKRRIVSGQAVRDLIG